MSSLLVDVGAPLYAAGALYAGIDAVRLVGDGYLRPTSWPSHTRLDRLIESMRESGGLDESLVGGVKQLCAQTTRWNTLVWIRFTPMLVGFSLLLVGQRVTPQSTKVEPASWQQPLAYVIGAMLLMGFFAFAGVYRDFRNPRLALATRAIAIINAAADEPKGRRSIAGRVQLIHATQALARTLPASMFRIYGRWASTSLRLASIATARRRTKELDMAAHDLASTGCDPISRRAAIRAATGVLLLAAELGWPTPLGSPTEADKHVLSTIRVRERRLRRWSAALAGFVLASLSASGGFALRMGWIGHKTHVGAVYSVGTLLGLAVMAWKHHSAFDPAAADAAANLDELTDKIKNN